MTSTCSPAGARAEHARLLGLATRGEPLSTAQLVTLLGDSERQQELFAAADMVRARHVGQAVHLRALIELSNHCRQDCHYCGLRRSNQALPRYRMSPAEIVDTARQAAALGYGTCVLQAGEDPHLDTELVADIVSEIKRETPLAVTLSLGERPAADYARWREAGADRYLLKIETTDPALFARLRPGRRLEQRTACLRALHELGYEVGSGFMVGLPGQSLQSLAGDLQFMRDLPCDMGGIGPFIPHPNTPLGEAAGGDLELSLRCLALARLLLPGSNLAATTATASLHPEGRRRALAAGANVIMPNVTPERLRVHYQIYPGKLAPVGSMAHYRRVVEALITECGRTVGTGRGDARRAQS